MNQKTKALWQLHGANAAQPIEVRQNILSLGFARRLL